MTDAADNPRAVAGHNQPPSDLDLTRARIEAATAALKARILDIAVALQRVPDPITPDIEGHVSDQIQQARDALADLDAIRVAHKKPLDDQANLVQRFCKDIEGVISAGDKKGAPPRLLEKLRARWDAYVDAKASADREAQDAERARLAAEAVKRAAEAAALEQQAEAAAQAAVTEDDRRVVGAMTEQARRARDAAEAAGTRTDAPTPGHVRGLGSATHQHVHWDYRVTDIAQVPRRFLMLDPQAVRAAIRGGARGSEIAGLVIERAARAVTRSTAGPEPVPRDIAAARLRGEID